MPKVKRKPFGNKKLDNMQAPLPPVSLLASADKRKAQQLSPLINMMQTLDELLRHYEIDAKGPEKWLTLCLQMASDFVPAFHFAKKRGKAAKWTWHDELALYVIIEYRRAQTDLPYSRIYQRAYKDAEGTQLERLVKKSTSAKTIENHHQGFQSSDNFKLLEKMLPNLQKLSKSGVLFDQIIYDDDYRMTKTI